MFAMIISYFSHLLMADFSEGHDAYSKVYKVKKHGETLFESKCRNECSRWACMNVSYGYTEVKGTVTINDGNVVLARIMGNW
jgi:hypothetical protein